MSSAANDMHSTKLRCIHDQLIKHAAEETQFGPNIRQAAVAVIVREFAGTLDVLFIKRARADGDPWSGQMAFPGGHLEPNDDSLLATAMRETLEETGVRLSVDQYLGRLNFQRPASRTRSQQLFVMPFVFGVSGDPQVQTNHEVEAVVWGSLSQMMDGSLHSTEVRTFAASTAIFNGYRLGSDKFVWGLTYRTLQEFFTVLDPHYRIPSDPS